MGKFGAMSSSPETRAPAERQNGIDRAVEVLEAVLFLRKPCKIGELAAQMKAPRSTVYSIVNRLIQADILENVDQDGRVYFGKAIHLYGQAYVAANPLHHRCREVLEQLAKDHDATTQLCALRGNKYVVVDARDGSGLFRITTDVGVEVPLPWTASGRILLDHMSPEAIRAFVPAEDYRLPSGQLLAADTFVAEVARARQEGKFVTTALSDRFASCLAAPIRDRKGIAVATLCFVIPADSLEDRQELLLNELVRAANALSETSFG